MRHLITGVTGFVGGHLVEALAARGEGDVVGVSRGGTWPAAWGHLAGRVDLRACDLTDGAAVEALLRDVRPERIYHLAGYASAGRSFREADAAWAGNLGATRTLYDAVVRWGERPRIVFVGSGLVYGDAGTADQACGETSELRPASPYAASKAAADLLSYQMAIVPGLDIVRARPFNHIGPRQSTEYAVASFARQIAETVRGRRPPLLETGNLAARRDLSDVRDVVLAYILLAERGRRGEAYNVGSGTAVAMRDVVDRLVALAGVAVEVRARADLLRPSDAAALCADADKLRRETGWAPAFALDDTLRATLDDWLSRA